MRLRSHSTPISSRLHTCELSTLIDCPLVGRKFCRPCVHAFANEFRPAHNKVRSQTSLVYLVNPTPPPGPITKHDELRKFYSEVWLNSGMRGVFLALGFTKKGDTVVLDPLAPNTLDIVAAVLQASSFRLMTVRDYSFDVRFGSYFQLVR